MRATHVVVDMFRVYSSWLTRVIFISGSVIRRSVVVCWSEVVR